MQKTRWFAVALGTLLLLLVACSTNGTNSSTTTSSAAFTLPTGEKLYVLDGSTQNRSNTPQIIGFHPGGAATDVHITLPSGLISQDHQHVYTATPQGGQTQITVTNTQTGATIRSLTIPGNYSTADQNYTQSVISFDGHWLALHEQGTTTSSTVALIDTQAGKLVKTIQLQGNFDLDALSPNGLNLYLLERLGDAAGHYNVRLYQVDTNQLYEYPIIDKQDIDPRMVGSALTRQLSPDGMLAYTLYTDIKHNIAFVHILPLNGTGFPFARCIDLPKGNSADLLRYYTLTLSADGSTLYAANGTLGLVSTITNIGNDAQDAQISTKAHFDPGNTTNVDTSSTLHNGAVLSADQKTLYFLGIRGIWMVHTSDLTVKRSYAPQQAFTGIALSSDGQTIYAVHPTSGLTMVNVSTGQVQQISQSPAHAPWGIEWITN